MRSEKELKLKRPDNYDVCRHVDCRQPSVLPVRPESVQELACTAHSMQEREELRVASWPQQYNSMYSTE